MQVNGKRPKKRKKSGIHKAVFLLFLICLLLGIVIVLLPPREGKKVSERAGQPTPGIENTGQAERLPEPVDTPSSPRPEVRHTDPRGRLALVMDDAGNSLESLRPFLRSPLKMTIAVLPGLPYTLESARMAAGNGKEVILHQPLEAVGGNALGPGGILTSQGDEDIIQILEKNLAELPDVKGVNNHMGSLGTADRRVMNLLMEVLAFKGLFFLDSLTTSATVAPEAALNYGVPLASRDVFLDNVVNEAEITARLDEGLALALEQGKAIVIGHVQNGLVIDVVHKNLERVAEQGVEFVFLSELYQWSAEQQRTR